MKLTAIQVVDSLGEAEVLGLKSPQAVSNIERGKVNITAADLYRLAKHFIIPIGYIFGEEYSDPRKADLIAHLRKLLDDVKTKIIGFVSATIDHQLVSIQYIEAIDAEDEEVKIKAVLDYYQAMGVYLSEVEKLREEAIRMRNIFDEHFGYVLKE